MEVWTCGRMPVSVCTCGWCAGAASARCAGAGGRACLVFSVHSGVCFHSVVNTSVPMGWYPIDRGKGKNVV